MVLVEAVWVLTAVHGWNKNQLLAMLNALTDSHDFTVQEPLTVAAAIASWEACRADFADCLALELARAHDELSFATFDSRAAKLPGALKP